MNRKYSHEECISIIEKIYQNYINKKIYDFGSEEKYLNYLLQCSVNIAIDDYKIDSTHTLEEFFDKYGSYIKPDEKNKYFYRVEELCLMDKNAHYWEIKNDSKFIYFKIPTPAKKFLFIALPSATIVSLIVALAVIYTRPSLNKEPSESFVHKCNTQLELYEQTNDAFITMYDLKNFLDSKELFIEDNAIDDDGNDVVWDMSVNRMAAVSSSGEYKETDTKKVYSNNKVDLWKVYDHYDSATKNEPYSKYMLDIKSNEESTYAIDDLNSGFDVGDNLIDFDINYIGANSSQTVLLRTSSTTNLIINATDDIVNHYGSSAECKIEAIGNDSYHEFGSSAFIEINKGHVVVEEMSFVSLMYANPGTYSGGSFTPDMSVPVSIENKGDIDHAHVCGVGSTGSSNANLVNGVSSGITFDYNDNTDQNAIDDIYHHVDNKASVTGSGPQTDADWDMESDVNKLTDMWLSFVDTHFEGEGTEEEPYQISSSEELAGLARLINSIDTNSEYSDKCYALTKDIDISSKAWTPIGAKKSTTYYPFNGTFTGEFDGENHKIVGLTNKDYLPTDISGVEEIRTTTSTGSVYGLFAYAFNATISNIEMTDVRIAADGSKFEETASIIGWAQKGLVMKNCKAAGLVKSDSEDVIGGLVGEYNEGSHHGTSDPKPNYIMENCEFTGIVSAGRNNRYTRAGGLVGFFNGYDGIALFKNCTSNATVNVPNTDASSDTSENQRGASIGAFIGSSKSTQIEIYDNCKNNATLNGSYRKGIKGASETITVSDSPFTSTNVSEGGVKMYMFDCEDHDSLIGDIDTTSTETYYVYGYDNELGYIPLTIKNDSSNLYKYQYTKCTMACTGVTPPTDVYYIVSEDNVVTLTEV